MAEQRGVWGIDIGQAGLKAVKLRYAEEADQVIAVAFDYVAHPKILSQPDAIPEELIPQALAKFLERNDVQGDRVAISVPGQTALARFIQLPPVESGKIAEIVKYEARQQIPFALDEVIWDYQTLGGGTEESGFMLEAEVGLFAMKRDQVLQQLKPFTEAKVEVDLIQIAPLALYNYLIYDQLGIRPDDESSAMGEYTILIDMGADNTTLLVTNGEKIWIRNVPIGGNHFTRALTKDMKLTFAKAEHLKCNATKSPDPRAVFQSLRPVFNDYVSEIQRSIGYFSSVNRDAKISKVLGLGNGFKLAGLQKFLQQNLQYEVERVDAFHAVVGENVLNAPLFTQNILSFAVPYGLALQGLNLGRIHTTLLPPEIATARTIREKKPWAVLAGAALLLTFALSMTGASRSARWVSPDRWRESEKQAKQLTTDMKNIAGEFGKARTQHKKLETQETKLVVSSEDKVYWMEVYKAIYECVPRDKGSEMDNEDPALKNQIRIKTITNDKKKDLSEWFKQLEKSVKDDYMLEADRNAPPEGEGFVFTLQGVHYHHEENNDKKRFVTYVETTLLNSLKQQTIQNNTGVREVPVRKLGITHAVITAYRSNQVEISPADESTGRYQSGYARTGRRRRRHDDDDRTVTKRGRQYARLAPQDDSGDDKKIKLWETVFTLQFAWKETPPSKRNKDKQQGKQAPKNGKAAK